jgi:ABC-type branched-subunit amino acid transport system substrate-binding protein
MAALLPLSGPAAPWGQRTWNGIQLACEVVNARGGVRALGGARLTAAATDTESRAEVAGLHAERVIARGAAALIGCNQSAASMVVSEIAERAGVPFITPTDREPTITARGVTWTFRTAPTLDAYARDLLVYVMALGERQRRPPRRLALRSDRSIVGERCRERLDLMAAAGVSAVAVLWDALEQGASSDRRPLREAIAATDLRTGDRMCLQLRGVKFLPSGDNARAGGLVVVVRDGTHRPVAPPEYAQGAARYPKPPWTQGP